MWDELLREVVGILGAPNGHYQLIQARGSCPLCYQLWVCVCVCGGGGGGGGGVKECGSTCVGEGVHV